MEPVTTNDEQQDLEKANKGLIADLTKQRQKARQLEEENQRLNQRISAIEESLNAPEPEPATDEVNRLAAAPTTFIKEVVLPIIESRVKPIEQSFTRESVNRQIEEAFEEIADREGITKKQARKKYEEKLAEISKERGFFSLNPFDGTLSAYDILKTEAKKKEEEESKRDEVIKENFTEAPRSTKPQVKKRWSRSLIREIVAKGEYNKYREEILEAQNQGLIDPN